MVFSIFFLFLSFCGIAQSIKPLPEPLSCQDKCISDFDNSDEDACLRGCSMSEVRPSKCKESCDDTYKDSQQVQACYQGCSSDGIVKLRIKLLAANSDNVPNIMDFFKSIFSPRNLNSQDLEKPTVPLDKVDNKPVSEDEDSNSDGIAVTRIRIFRFINGGQDSPIDLSSILKSMKNLLTFNNMTNGELINTQSLKDMPIDEPRSIGRRFTLLLRHVSYRPLFLPCVALSLLLVLLFFKLVICLCRRKKRDVQYTLLPSYAESVTMKVPNCNEEAEDLPPKAPIDA